MTLGGWLSAAVASGRRRNRYRLSQVIATLILGIPWWTHRRRRARVRIERTMQAWPDMAENMGLPGSRIASATGDAWGYTARVILRKGTTAVQAINQVPAIESGLGIRPGSVRAIPDPDRADRVIVRVIETDPHAQPIPWPGQSDTTITKPVELGLFEDGRPVVAAILRRNVLIGGTTGSGKSGIVNVVMAYLVACLDVMPWAVDLKGGMELQPWAAMPGPHRHHTPRDHGAIPRRSEDAGPPGRHHVRERSADLAARPGKPGPAHRGRRVCGNARRSARRRGLGSAARSRRGG